MLEMQEIQVRSLSQDDPLKEGTATHSSILAWRIPWILLFWAAKDIDGFRCDMAEMVPVEF